VPHDKFDQFLQLHPNTDTFLTEEAKGERRQKFYRSTGLKVGAGENTEISLDIGRALVRRTKVLPVVLATPHKLR
jgi:hypothetical protein